PRVAGREDRAAAEDRRGRGRLPRPARARVRRHELRAARARGLRLRRDRNRALVDRLCGRRQARDGDRRLPECDQGRRGRREGLEALTRVGVAGLGYWGPNLARNFDDLAQLEWICDESAERLAEFSARYPHAKPTGSFVDMLNDPEVDAVV